MFTADSRKVKIADKSHSRCSAWKTEHLVILFAFLFTSVCLLMGFFNTPKLYPVDHGQYETIMKECGLTWTEEDLAKGSLQYERPITEFEYVRFNWSNLLTPNAGSSIVYLLSVIRIFTEPLGMQLSVEALSIVSCVFMIFSVTLLTLALYRLLPRGWYIPLLLSGLIFSDGNFCAMFRGLYREGSAIIFLMFCGAIHLRTWSLPTEKRTRWMPAVLLSSFLLLKSVTPMIVFLPFVIVEMLCLYYSCYHKFRFTVLWTVLSFLFLFTGISSTLELAGNDADYFSNASVYESVFNTMLPASEDSEALLAEIGLDNSYKEDIGKTFYEEESAYAHNPRDPEEAQKLFEVLNISTVIRCYLHHPSLLFTVLDHVPYGMEKGFENIWNMGLKENETGFQATRVGTGISGLLWRLLSLSYKTLFALFMLMSILCIAAAVITRKKIWLLGMLLIAGMTLYLPFAVVLNGYALCAQYILPQVFMAICAAGGVFCIASCTVPYLKAWFTQYMMVPYTLKTISVTEDVSAEQKSSAGFFSKIAEKINRLQINRKQVTVFTAVLSIGILTYTYLTQPHIASVNNGDFGRMMKQMGLTWPGNIYYDISSQMGHRAIEEYAYLESFDPLKLTPVHASYGLYWFVSIVRVLTEPFGKMFSTTLLAWIMGLIVTICIIRIVWDLYPLLGRWTMLLAGLLLGMQLSETYLVWHNSLYGEGCIIVGLMLVIMCTVHLCTMSGKYGLKTFLWQIGLVISLYIMITAKSQMLMAAPGALLLLIVMFLANRPYRYDFQVLVGLLGLGLCIVLAFGAFRVYQSDRTEDSVSQKHTMWQAYFYGIFMIADDPVGDMEELGIDTAMAADIGKFVQFGDDSQYVYAPLSEEAQTAFYDHVSMGTIVKWYLTHPLKLLHMLDYAAGEAKELYTGFRVYNDQDYSKEDHDEVNGRNIWPGWRKYLTPGNFWGYVLFFVILLVISVRRMLCREIDLNEKLLWCIPLFLIITAALQYPLSVLGNGFADNQKQLFCFSLCYDILLAGVLTLGSRWLIREQEKIQRRIKSLPQSVKLFFLRGKMKREGEAYDPETDPVDHNSML